MIKEAAQRNLEQVYQRIERKLKVYLQYDPKVQREDTCQGMKAILNEIKSVLESLNNQSVQERIENYHYTYNAVVYTLDICRLLRKSQYSFEAVDFLLTCIVSMQANLILQDAKYLDMRTKLYLQVAHIYEQQEALLPAINILNVGIDKLNELTSIHQADPPVPEYISKIIQNNMRYLKIMLIKYRIQSVSLPVGEWKKKVDQDFGTNTEAKLACLVECLRTRTPKFSNMFEDRKSNFKEALVNTGYDLIKGDVSLLCTALEQQKERIQRIVAFKATQNLTQQITNQEIRKRREFEEKLVKEKDYTKASQNIPLQYHCELLHYAYEVKNIKVFQELANWAIIRIKCRRIEVKYITDVSILASTIPNPNIPNEYQKLPVDLNEGNLRLELAKLRNSGKSQPPSIEGTKAEQAPPPAASKQPPKKGGKEPIKQQLKEKDKDNSAPTKWQLQQIKHKYVYLLLKRSMNPDKAIYGIDIVMGHEEHGPVGYQDTRRIVVPYIQSNASVKTSEVDQYTGVQATTQLVPYIILYHSKDSLSDENERKTIITDVKPIFGKHPMVRPDPGYTKIQVDLRQVPPEFIRQKHNDYIFLSYKTDSLFNINQRHTEILVALNQLEQTYAKTGNLANNCEQEKTIELDINYDLTKLDVLFETLERSLRGVLGEEYYSKKTDFLTQLLSYVWVKYLRGALAQFDYVNEQRLSGEIIDFDYDLYREIIQKAKPVFLRGLKVLNIILVQNSKADMLLLCKINLELCKLLEEDGDYKTAIDNLRFCVAKTEDRRNAYLRRGLDSKFDKPLPLSVTCSNVVVEKTLESMKQAYIKQKLFILKQLRINERKSKDQKGLTEAELKQQEFEFADDCKQQPELKQFISNKHRQFPLLLMALHTDMLNNLFRLELKQGERIRKIAASRKKITNNPTSKGLNASGFEESEVEGLAASFKQKMGLMYTKSEVQNKKNLHQLQATLQKAGKLQPPNPVYHSYQSKLIEETNKNPYAMALLLINIAGNKQNDRRYLLSESLKAIQKAKEEETKILAKAVENSIFLVSALWDRQIDNTSSNSIFPFKQLYNGTWPSQALVPDPPILVAKSSNSITLKLPPQTYPVNQKDPAELKAKKNIVSMSVYGKISAHGVDVSTNCNELNGTGLKYNIGSVVQVRQLQSNNQYCFACASTDSKDEQGSIGKTGQDIGTYHPLPLNLILGYLAKAAFQLGEYDIAKSAAMGVIEEFCEASGYINQDGSTNNLYYYRFKQNNLKSVSLLQIRWLSETLIIGARCLMKERQLQQSQSRKAPTSGIISVQSKCQEDRVSNLLILCSLLSPALPSPNQSLPLLFSKSNILQASLLISMTPPKFMSPRLRTLSYKIMYELMKWGLQNNQIALARRLSYKWGEKKWMMLGKIMRIEEKKELGKKGKDGKEANKEQEVKVIEKYVRVLVEKSPEVVDGYLDAGIALHEDYADYMAMFVERVKEQINTYSQYVENPPQQLDRMVNDLNAKLELIEYLKDPAASITKVPATSPFYLESVCKLLRRAIELPADLKQLNDMAPNIGDPAPIPAVKTSVDIKSLLYESIKSDVDWSPQNLPTLKTLQQKTGQNLSKPIQLFEKYLQLRSQLIKQKQSEDILADRNKDSDYVHQWLGQLYLLKATASTAFYSQTYKSNTSDVECYYNLTLLDLEDLMKRVKEKQIVDKTSFMHEDKRYEQMERVFAWIANSCYCSLMAQQWTALQNAVKLAYNFIVYYSLTPFNHWHKPIYEHFTMISFCLITMLKRIKEKGYFEARTRYQKRLVEKELALIQNKLGINKQQRTVTFAEDDQFKFEQPKLQTEAPKKFWFTSVKQLDVGVLSNFICYTVQCLRIQQKFRLLIGLSREFSNATQHRHSLYLLPFIIEAQQRLLLQSQTQLQQKQQQLSKATQLFMAWKTSKKKGSRQATVTGQKPKQQLEYQQTSKSLNETINLIKQKVAMQENEKNLSRSIVEELRRDSNQAVLMQKEQHKILVDVGADEARMYRMETEDTKLSRNRKNTMLKELIAKYTDIFKALRGNKTSKDTLSQIQNLHEVGNLYFAAGVLDRAAENWSDALANIMQRVNPVECFRDIFEQKGPLIVNSIGLSETFLAVNLLVKLAWTCYFNKLHLQRESILMAGKLLEHIFKIDSAHPQTLRRFSLYRLKRIKDTDAFQDQTTINLSELLFSCEYLTWGLFDSSESVRSLPTLCLMDYIATDIVKNTVYSMRAKLMKSLMLADIGMIREAILMLTKAVSEKDLPLMWIRQSEYVKRERGCNWYPTDTLYNNAVGASENVNKEVIDSVKKMEVGKGFEGNYGFVNAVLATYARAMVILSANESEVFQSTDVNDLRCQNLVFAEGLLRDCLKRLAFLEEFYQLLQILRKSQSKFKSNEMDDSLKKKVQQSKTTLISYLKAQGIDQASQPLFLNEDPSNDKRSDRLALMARIRNSICRANQARNMWTRSYYVLKYGLFNLYRQSNDARLVETGYQKENDDSSKQQATLQVKKDDKKGKKDGKEEIKEERKDAPIDTKKEEELRQMAEARKYRTTSSAFWHLKLQFQLGKLLYKQSRYKQSIAVLTELKLNSQLFQDRYFFLLSEGYVLRSKLKLGLFNPQHFQSLISNFERSCFFDISYVDLVCDYAEVCEDAHKSYELFEKARKCFEEIAVETGLASYFNSRNDNSRKIQYCLELQLSQENEEEIKLRGKKVDPGKKAGKDDKKAPPKKDDPKKKKEEVRVEYKVQPLNNFNWYSLVQEEKNTYQLIDTAINSNELQFNCYFKLITPYVKTKLRPIRSYLCLCSLNAKQTQSQLEKYLKELTLLEELIKRSQNIPVALKLECQELQGLTSKKLFLAKMEIMREDLRMDKQRLKGVTLPYEDLPLNKQYLLLPPFQQFLKDNRPILQSSSSALKKLVQTIKGQALFSEYDMNVQEVFWELSDICLLLAQYQGRLQPKYNTQHSADLQHQLEQTKIQKLNLLLQANKYLEYSIRVWDCRRELTENYSQIGKKAFEPGTTKLDQDIVTDILETDLLYKKEYPGFDESKKKTAPTYIDLMTYMLKMAKESQVMTYSNPHFQNNITKCHRFLCATLPSYKDKCVLNSVQIAPKKDINSVFIDPSVVTFKSLKTPKSTYIYLYIVGPVQPHKHLRDPQTPCYGRVTISSEGLSSLSTSIYNLKEKMTFSDSRTAAQKQRDYKFHKEEFTELMVRFSGYFFKKGGDMTVMREIVPELTHQNVDILTSMFRDRGVTVVSQQVNYFVRYLHSLKYPADDAL